MMLSKYGSWHVCQSHLCLKEKEQSDLSRSPDCGEGETQEEQEVHFGKKERNLSRSMIKKGWTPQ